MEIMYSASARLDLYISQFENENEELNILNIGSQKSDFTEDQTLTQNSVSSFSNRYVQRFEGEQVDMIKIVVQLGQVDRSVRSPAGNSNSSIF